MTAAFTDATAIDGLRPAQRAEQAKARRCGCKHVHRVAGGIVVQCRCGWTSTITSTDGGRRQLREHTTTDTRSGGGGHDFAG